jgi:hypothetical protein
VLAELGGDRTHTDAAVDLDRGADVRDLAQFAIGGVLDEAAVTTCGSAKFLHRMRISALYQSDHPGGARPMAGMGQIPPYLDLGNLIAEQPGTQK